MQEDKPMLFADGMGSLSGKGWQAQAQEEFQKLTYYSNWWPRFYTWSQNIQLRVVQEFTMGNKKDLFDGWYIHAWGALANSFDSTFTKWLMR